MVGLSINASIVKDYECDIDTGDARPIQCRNLNFGPLEPILEQAIAKLIELGNVYQIHDGEWLSKPLLATKPHQENLTDIEDFVCRFCVSYIVLNAASFLGFMIFYSVYIPYFEQRVACL